MLKSLLGVMSPVHIQLVTLFSGSKKMGKDPFGNTYFRGKPRPGYKRERRWVMYKGAPEASKVPPEWHGWLHHQSDVFPSLDGSGISYRRTWQKPHLPNMTGTNHAYHPPGSLLKEGKRPKTTGDYEAWTPEEINSRH